MFATRVKEGPKHEVHLNIKEIERLLAFARWSHLVNHTAYITLTGSETGIGMHLEASDFEGATSNITDYDAW